MNDSFSLANQHYVVSGACGDIGKGIIQAIEAAGGVAIGWDLREEPGVIAIDVTDREAVQRELQAQEAATGVDGIVTAAGIIGRVGSDFLSITEDEWHRVIDVNLWGTFNVLQSWAELRKKAGRGGAAVTISSMVTKVATAHNPHYVASKGGIDALTRSAAVALGPLGIRVNSVNPGPVPTGMNPHLWQSEEGRAKLLKGVVLGRLGAPENIGKAAAFLLSDASEWTTGTSLYVDGGVSIAR